MEWLDSGKNRKDQIPVLALGEPIPVVWDEPVIHQKQAPFEWNAARQPSADADAQKMYDAAGPSVVNIKFPVPEGERTGTAFAVGDGHYLMTAAHVLDGAQEVKVETFDGKRLSAHVIPSCKDGNSDIGVIAFDDPYQSLPPLHLGDSHDVGVGDKVQSLSHPFGLAPLYSSEGTNLGTKSGLEAKRAEIREKIASGGALADVGKIEETKIEKEYNSEVFNNKHGWLSREQIYVNMHQEAGSSGSPLLIWRNGKPEVVGVDSEGYSSRTKVGFQQTFEGYAPIELGIPVLKDAPSSDFFTPP